jgi:hypothetical protein
MRSRRVPPFLLFSKKIHATSVGTLIHQARRATVKIKTNVRAGGGIMAGWVSNAEGGHATSDVM